MYLVVLNRWPELAGVSAQTLAGLLGVTAYDVRQRLVGAGPIVLTSCAQVHLAEELLVSLIRNGCDGFLLDPQATAGGQSRIVRRFLLNDDGFYSEDLNGNEELLSYHEVSLLLPALGISSDVETKTVSSRKLSLGKTFMAGGIPLSKKVRRQEEQGREERERLLFLVAESGTRLVCMQNSLKFEGLGEQLKPSRELNFSFLIAELRRLCPSAGYDDRLITRAGQVRLLGPLLAPESHLDLAVDILSRHLQASGS